MKKNLFTLFLGLAAATAPAQNFTRMASNETFARQLRELGTRTTTIKSHFTQVRYMSVAGGEVCSQGNFYYQTAGENICLEFSAPAGDMIVLRGDKFRIVAAGRETVVAVQAHPMLRQLRSMLSACMQGNMAPLEAGNTVEYYESPSEYQVVLVPAERRAARYMSRMVLTFDKRDMSLNAMKIDEPSGDYTRYTFDRKKFNETIAADKFRI